MRKCLPYFMFKDTVLDRIRSRGALTDFKSTHIKWIEAKETAALRDMEKAHKSTNELFVMFKGNPAKGVVSTVVYSIPIPYPITEHSTEEGG